MNAKKAKKLRRMLREVVAAKLANNEKVTERGYVEVEKNRKYQMFEVPENYEEIIAGAEAEAAKVTVESTAEAKPAPLIEDPAEPSFQSDKPRIEISDKRKMKKFQIAPGTLIASHGTVRGVYVALKKGLKMGSKQVQDAYNNTMKVKQAL